MAAAAMVEQVKAAVQDVRNDSTKSDWVTFGIGAAGSKPGTVSKSGLKYMAKGAGGIKDLLAHLSDDKPCFAFVRYVAGDQESKRIKFLFITWCGKNVTPLARAKCNAVKPEAVQIVGQFHVDFVADSADELTENIINEKIRKFAGANYDLGSNASGYETKGGAIKQSAASRFKELEKETTLKQIVFDKGPLHKGLTPVDLSGRRTVAPPTEARKNTVGI